MHRADHAHGPPLAVANRTPLIEEPAVTARLRSHAIVDGVGSVALEMGLHGVDGTLPIVGMDQVFPPLDSVAHLPFAIAEQTMKSRRVPQPAAWKVPVVDAVERRLDEQIEAVERALELGVEALAFIPVELVDLAHLASLTRTVGSVGVGFRSAPGNPRTKRIMSKT